MEPIDKRIIRFFRKHHIFTLATSASNIPYVSTCFYIYQEKLNRVVFTSGKETRHTQELEEQPIVAGAIALETLIIGRIQGIQFTGTAFELKGTEYEDARIEYITKFPVAAFQDLTLWAIQVDFIKMTHNQLGFGKKLIWKS